MSSSCSTRHTSCSELRVTGARQDNSCRTPYHQPHAGHSRPTRLSYLRRSTRGCQSSPMVTTIPALQTLETRPVSSQNGGSNHDSSDYDIMQLSVISKVCLNEIQGSQRGRQHAYVYILPVPGTSHGWCPTDIRVVVCCTRRAGCRHAVGLALPILRNL